MFHVEQLRNQYPDARHVCYGYIIGDPHNTTRQVLMMMVSPVVRQAKADFKRVTTQGNW